VKTATTTTTALGVLAALLCTTASPAAAQDDDEDTVIAEDGELPDDPLTPIHDTFVIGAATNVLWRTDTGYDLFAPDDPLPAADVFAGLDVLRLGDDVAIGVELGWGIEVHEAAFAQAAHAHYESHSFSAAAHGRRAITDWLGLDARLALGASYGMARITGTDAEPLADSDWSFFGSAGLGATLRTPRGLFTMDSGAFRSLSFGLTVEAGYVLASPHSFAVAPEEPGNAEAAADRLAPAGVALGDVARAAPYLRFAFFARM
jgi:hypothetical protein